MKPGDLITYSETVTMPLWMTPASNGNGIFDPIVDVGPGDVALLVYIDDNADTIKSQNIYVVAKNTSGWSASYLWSRVKT